jgi:hypothetical protein
MGMCEFINGGIIHMIVKDIEDDAIFDGFHGYIVWEHD